MKVKQKKSAKATLSDKIADALTLKPRADIEDDQVFGTKPLTVSRGELGSSDSDDETAISDFRKRNVNLLSEISKKYEGQVVSRKEFEKSDDSDSDDEVPTIDKLASKSKLNLEYNTADSDEESEPSELKTRSNKTVSDSEDSGSDGESDDYSITQFKKQVSLNDESSVDGEEDESGDDEDDEGEGYDISQMTEPVKESFEHVKKQNVSEEAKKGIAVRNQLLVWEGLLEMRIHLQRCMNTANQMPLPETFEGLKKDSDFMEESNTTKVNVANALEKLLNLQSLLLQKFPETKTLSTKKQGKVVGKHDTKQDSDEEIPSDTDNEEIPSDTEGEDDVKEDKPKETVINNPIKKRKLEDYEKEIATSHKMFKTFRDTTIQKWNEKTRLSTATNIKNAPTNTILQQISYILSDKDKLIRRTQLKRSEYDIIGYKNNSIVEENKDQYGVELNPVTRDRKEDDEYIADIFDDSDFYHQLLRELIECKSADISDPVQLSRQWIALQQMRSKMKRKVDTKATKGRKIKYVVHNKLVNYMAPVKSAKWTDESKNELYSSLFGKMFEHNNVGINGNLVNVIK